MSKYGNNQPRYTKADVDRFLHFLKKTNGNVSAAARLAGITGGRQRVNAWLRKYDWFADRYAEVMDQFLDFAEALHRKKAKTNLTAAIRLLTLSPEGKERGWGRRTEMTGKGGGPLLSFRDMVEKGDKG